MTSRREFGKAVALGGMGALIAEPVAAQPNRSLATVAEALGAIVQARYGDFLDARQMEQVQRSIARSLLSAERMKQVKLQNGDEPAFTFSADAPE